MEGHKITKWLKIEEKGAGFGSHQPISCSWGRNGRGVNSRDQ